MDRARRALALVVLCMAVAGVSTACAATNPQQTALKYDPADGETVSLGSVQVDNLLVVSKAGTDGPGTLVARLTNTSDQQQTVTFSGSGGADLDATFTVPSNDAVSVGPDQQDSAVLSTVGAQPGALVDVKVSAGSGTDRTVQVPIVTSTQPYYASLVPTPTPTPTYTPPPPSPSPSPSGRSSRSGSTMTPVPFATPSVPSVTASPSRTPGSLSTPGSSTTAGSSMAPSYSPRTTLTPSSSPVT